MAKDEFNPTEGDWIILKETGLVAQVARIAKWPRTVEREVPPDKDAYYVKEESNGPNFGPYALEDMRAYDPSK